MPVTAWRGTPRRCIPALLALPTHTLPTCWPCHPTQLLQAGDLVTFPKGMSCTWDVKEVRLQWQRVCWLRCGGGGACCRKCVRPNMRCQGDWAAWPIADVPPPLLEHTVYHVAGDTQALQLRVNAGLCCNTEALMEMPSLQRHLAYAAAAFLLVSI